jgi:effector-binding domain-containing protein
MKKKSVIGTLVILSLFLIGGLLVGPMMSQVENPTYKVTSSLESIEIRAYEPMIVAEIEVQGERKQALKRGFRLLADYIFGNNTAKHKIAMTAPVQQHVSQDGWTVSFVMPSLYNMISIPQPHNKDVVLKEIPAKHFIAIQFSGMNSDANIHKHKKKIMKYITHHNIKIVGPIYYAFYNPPWTLPFMRRNEIIIEIKE